MIVTLFKLKKFNDNYDANQKGKLEAHVIRYMMKFRTPRISVYGMFPNEMYKRQNNSRLGIVEDENKLRVLAIHKCCVIENDEQLERIKQKLNPLLSNKMRAIRLMGGPYEEVREEIEKEQYQVLSIF